MQAKDAHVDKIILLNLISALAELFSKLPKILN